MALITALRRRSPSRQGSTDLAGRDFLLLLAATLGTFANYAALLSAVPLWSARGGADSAGVGATTGVTMATTVGAQLCMAWLLKQLGLRQVLVIGALLLGVPTFAYPLSADLTWVLAVSAVRGAGFGMVAVAGSALVAELVPVGSRGRAVGRYGVAVGLPHVLCLPGGVWMAEHVGFTAVFVTAGALSVLAVPVAAAIGVRPDRSRRESTADGRASRRPGVRLGPLAGPFTVLVASACALGGVASFLPLSLDDAGSGAPAALFFLSVAVIAGRWAAGAFSDRAGVGRLMVPSVLACVAGMGGFALSGTSAGGGTMVLPVASAVVYGLGFGAMQNDTLMVMFSRSRSGGGGHGMASTVWNMAYDGGTGAGALAVGLASHAVGINGSFAAAAGLVLLVAPIAARDARTERHGRAQGGQPQES